MSQGENTTTTASAPRLLTMPDDGVDAVKRLIDAAEHSLAIKMFEFDCPVLVSTLIAARRRGVEVEVLLNPVRSSGLRPNDNTMERLRDADIAAHWSSPRFPITHEKSMIVDGRTALIATFNLSSKYLTRTRDYGLLIEDATIVAEMTRCFAADRAGERFTPSPDSPLAWGNQNARTTTAAFIDGAKKELYIQHPKFRDAAILDHVVAARERGVNVRYLCGGKHGIEPRDLIETLSYQRILDRGGIKLRKQRQLKLHAKLMVADGERAMLGSMNIDRDAYDVRRELGIVFADAPVVSALVKRFEADWHDAKTYKPADPLHLNISAIDDPDDGDTILMHE